MIFNILGGSTCVFSIVAALSGHYFIALGTCAIGIALCLAEIHNRDKTPMTATLITFPAAATQRLQSMVTILHLDGRTFATAGFLPGNPGDAWNWIAATVAAELECNEEDVHVIEGEDGDDTIGVDGLPAYRVEIVRPARMAPRVPTNSVDNS